MTARVYADHVAAYAQAGWPCILPVPPETKTPPPVGFTGAEGRDTDPLDLVSWVGPHLPGCVTSGKDRCDRHDRAGYSIALRMPDGIIGIDVDSYLKGEVTKRGAETLAACIARWGPLPATWTSTARDPHGPSRIYFFRAPAGRYATKLVGDGTSDVEVIQRHHRYAVVWPSPHKDAGGIYRWYDPAGVAVDAPPKPEELAELPPAWVAGLAEGATEQGAAAADTGSGQVLLEQLLEDWRPECADITSARLTAAAELAKADAGSRHDTMTARVHHLVQLAASGHTGVAYAVEELRNAWAALTAGEDRADELERMLLTSARKAVTVVGLHQVTRDPCLLIQGFAVPPAAPADDRPDDPDRPPEDQIEGIEPGRWYSVREAIGTHAFDPNAGLDQSLAEAVLLRMYPALRYAYDSGSWLLKVPDRWEERKDLAAWAVAQLAPLMPVGDPTAEKGSEQHMRAANRARLMGTPGAKAVAAKIDALLKGGTHPASLRLGALDSDPEILWAGGMPYSLRRSHDGPTLAALDPATPHLHTAQVTPEKRPTPLWDAFTAAVWPDPAVRRWALRVLAISFTGYSDRALPVLLGETGRGKTQVVHLLMSVLGTYAHAANAKLLAAGTNEHDTIVFALKGRRLSFIDEAPGETKTGQERLKQLTGGGELEARQMNRDPITFRPTHTLVLTANDEPLLTDPAVRSRVRLLPCDGDPELVRRTRAAIGHVSSAAWRTEAPGVLALMMAEAAAWLGDPSTGLVAAAPDHVRYLAEHIGAEQDPVAVWVAEETEPFEAGTPSRELYQAFTASCLRNNVRRDQIPSETKWGRAVTRLGYGSFHTVHGKRRPLRIRTGSYMPGMPPMPTSGAAAHPPAPAVDPDGLDRTADGFMSGSSADPSGAFSQVNPTVSVDSDGSDGLSEDVIPHARTHAHVRSGPGNAPDPSSVLLGEPPNSASDLHKQAPDGSDGPEPSADPPAKAARKPRKAAEQTAEAREKALAAKAEKLRAAIAAASGEHTPLPAVVTRDGAIRSACDLAALDALLATITGSAGDLTVDIENTGYPVGHADYALRTVQLGNENFAVVLNPHDPDHADLARRHLAAAGRLHAHSATADLVPLEHAGLIDADDAWARMYDTVVPAKLADPDSTGSDPGLKKLATAVLGNQATADRADEARSALFKAGKWLTETKVTTALERSGWAQVSHECEVMVRYDASDVLDTGALATRLPWPAPEILERERTAQRMTARVAHSGLRIDSDQVERLMDEHVPIREQFAEQVRAFGIENPGSDQQVGAALIALGAPLPRTPTGKPSVAKGVIEPFADVAGPIGDLVTKVLEYRHHDTAITMFLEPYQRLVRHGDGRARPTVYTLGADTGRMSCVRPNLQQVPREGGFRACLTADPGELLISADFSGVEFRVAAALSQDENLIRMLAEGVDLHAESAAQVFGPQATKANRYTVKRGNFGWLYGGKAPTLAKQMSVSVATAQALIDTLAHMLPGVTGWSELIKSGVEAGRTQFPTYAGRVVHLPKRAPHAGPNYCIQGTARELLIDALLRWEKTRWGSAVLLPVHDEVVAKVPEDQAEEATQALVEVMATELYGVPIIAEASTPTFAWSDAS